MLLAFQPSLVAAEESSQDTPIRTAIAVKERALDTGKSSDWTEALRLFSALSQMSTSAEVSYEMGYAASQVGQVGLAVESYERALALGLKGPAAVRAQQYSEERRPVLAVLELCVGYESTLRINGYIRGPSQPDCHVYVDPGTVHLESVSQVGAIVTRDLACRAGEVVKVNLAPAIAESPVIARAPSSPEATRPKAVAVPKRKLEITYEVHPYRTLGIALIAGGTTATLLGIAAIPVSTSNVRDARQALARACDVPSSNPDGCLHAIEGQQDLAQSHADSIATWKAARYVAWGTLGTGIAAIGAGAWLFSLTKPVALPTLALDGDRFYATYSGHF